MNGLSTPGLPLNPVRNIQIVGPIEIRIFLWGDPGQVQPETSDYPAADNQNNSHHSEQQFEPEAFRSPIHSYIS
jgi:hypothetical protein